VADKAPWTLGKATVAMVMSTECMMVGSITAQLTKSRRVSGPAAGAVSVT
jgi:hypothetical protein